MWPRSSRPAQRAAFNVATPVSPATPLLVILRATPRRASPLNDATSRRSAASIRIRWMRSYVTRARQIENQSLEKLQRPRETQKLCDVRDTGQRRPRRATIPAIAAETTGHGRGDCGSWLRCVRTVSAPSHTCHVFNPQVIPPATWSPCDVIPHHAHRRACPRPTSSCRCHACHPSR
jgi:hypothetical protein